MSYRQDSSGSQPESLLKNSRARERGVRSVENRKVLQSWETKRRKERE